MKLKDGWWWPDHEEHMLQWLATPKNRVVINGRPAYQGKKQLAVLQHCVRRGHAVDVGAHVGLWAHNLAPAFDRVTCIEPVLAHRECFAKNVQAENVDLRPIALGKEPGRVRISTTAGSSGDSKVAGPGDIEMATLDSLKLQDVDLIKIDCEGFEENVILGGEQTIRQWWPVICVEQKRDMASRFGLKPQGAVTLLKAWGYTVAQEIGGDYIMVHA